MINDDDKAVGSELSIWGQKSEIDWLAPALNVEEFDEMRCDDSEDTDDFTEDEDEEDEAEVETEDEAEAEAEDCDICVDDQDA